MAVPRPIAFCSLALRSTAAKVNEICLEVNLHWSVPCPLLPIGGAAAKHINIYIQWLRDCVRPTVAETCMRRQCSLTAERPALILSPQMVVIQ